MSMEVGLSLISLGVYNCLRKFFMCGDASVGGVNVPSRTFLEVAVRPW